MPAAFEVSENELREGLPSCLAVPRWVDEVASGGPYATLDELVDAAGLAATPLSAEEVDQALAEHPRRLVLDPDDEFKVAASELRDIAMRRVRQVFG